MEGVRSTWEDSTEVCRPLVGSPAVSSGPRTCQRPVTTNLSRVSGRGTCERGNGTCVGEGTCGGCLSGNTGGVLSFRQGPVGTGFSFEEENLFFTR